MKKNLKTNTSDILIDELQNLILSSPSLKKYHQESEKIIRNIQFPPHFVK
jgi:hypothetical protein